MGVGEEPMAGIWEIQIRCMLLNANVADVQTIVELSWMMEYLK
jgi:hypothetical protein